jgi:hypothetical protein
VVVVGLAVVVVVGLAVVVVVVVVGGGVVHPDTTILLTSSLPAVSLTHIYQVAFCNPIYVRSGPLTLVSAPCLTLDSDNAGATLAL